MQQLSVMDSLFLYLENEQNPMHVGSLFILRHKNNSKKFDFEEIKSFFKDRMHLSLIFKRKLLQTKLKVGRPYWMNDPDFNIDNHLTHIVLPKESKTKDLVRVTSDIHSKMMDRSKPLWHLYLITGLEDIKGCGKSSIALISQIHHSAIDGMSGAEIMGAVYDVTPKPRRVPPPTEEWKPDYIDSIPQLLVRDAVQRLAETPGKVKDFISDTTSSMFDLANQLGKDGVSMPGVSLSMNAPMTFFNKNITARKSFGVVDVSIERIKELKNIAGVKLNDVVLGICSTGLRKYLLEKGELPDKPLVAMVPVSVRGDSEKAAMGNRVSAMAVELASNEPDIIQRVNKIYENTSGSKMLNKAAPVDQIIELIPTEVAAIASKLYTQMGFLNKYALLYNLVITNVPGPPMPLYMNGYELQRHYGLGITIANVGIMITVFSMAGNISISITACEDLMPDVQNLANYIGEALDEMELAYKNNEKENDYFTSLAKKHGLAEEQLAKL